MQTLAKVMLHSSSFKPIDGKANHHRPLPHRYDYPARALRALGLLLADSAPTVGRGKTF